MNDETKTDESIHTNAEPRAPAIIGQPLVSLSGLGEAVAVGAQLAGIGPRLAFIGDPDRVGQPGAQVPVTLVTIPGGGHRVEVLDGVRQAFDEQAPGPRRRIGESVLTEESSFITFLKRWSSDRTVIYADTAALSFLAVLDDHPAGPENERAGWREDLARYTCPRSSEWIEWTSRDGKEMTQVQFGDFIESRLEDLTLGKDDEGKVLADAVRPLDMLTVARELTIHTKGTFRRHIDTTNGSFIFEHKTEHETGSTVIPRAFHIAIPVFDGGQPYQLEARVRFTFGEAGPRFAFVLHRRKETERDAFVEVRDRIGEHTGRLVLAGTP